MSMENAFTHHPTVLCVHCILTHARTTNVSKQYITPCPLIRVTVMRDNRSTNLPTPSLTVSPHLGQQNRVQNERIITCFLEVLSPTCYASNLAPVLRM